MLQINHILLLLIFASFPYGLPDHYFMLQFVLPAHPQDHEPSISPLSVCPSANRSSFHLPHTETRQWGPHPPFIFTDISALPGALILHWGTRFCILYIFPKIIDYSLYNHLYFQPFPLRYFGHHRWRPSFLFWQHATHVTLGWSITPHSPSPASSISSEYYPGHLPFIL
jgi:hypothetical protein